MHNNSPPATQGQQAEQIARTYLEQQGLTFVEANYHSRRGEIDLIFRDAGVLVFVEVRLRKSQRFGGAAASVTAQKQQRLILTAQRYLQQQHSAKTPACRFDVVAMSDLSVDRVDWIKDAFQPSV